MPKMAEASQPVHIVPENNFQVCGKQHAELSPVNGKEITNPYSPIVAYLMSPLTT